MVVPESPKKTTHGRVTGCFAFGAVVSCARSERLATECVGGGRQADLCGVTTVVARERRAIMAKPEKDEKPVHPEHPEHPEHPDKPTRPVDPPKPPPGRPVG